MSRHHGLSRRSFFRLAGGGIAVFVGLGSGALWSQPQKRLYPEDLNAYLLVRENGRITVFAGKIEMGQGVLTSLAQMAAEELGVDLESIDMVLGDTDQCPWDMGTFGSMTTRMFGPALRAAAAEARAVLLGLAAAQLGVPQDRLVVQRGVVMLSGDPSRRVRYGELSKGRKIARLVDGTAVLRAVRDFQVMGRSPQRLDGRDKVTGSAKYAADIRVPGMLYAAVLRPPAHGATPAHLDLAGAQAMAGVTVVRRDDLVATLHADSQLAAAALERIRVEWRTPSVDVDEESISDHLERRAGDPQESTRRGDPAARPAGTRLFEARYRKGYVAHAPLEPHAALADVRDGKATVWASTQTPFPTRDRIAKTLGFEPRDVRVITPFVGGGFGGKSADRQAVDAARLSQISGRPVQVAWDRTSEFYHDTFDPAAVVRIVSGLDFGGRIALWDYCVFGAGERGTHLVYDIPALRIRSAGALSYDPNVATERLHPFAVGPWRAPGANMNVFAAESQIDLMATAAGVDPLEFRLRHLSDARMRAVLQAAATTFGWKAAARRNGSGRGIGIACATDAGSYVATMAEVEVDRAGGHVQVRRVVCAQDMGIVVNPDGARMQIEGGITMGLGYTLSEELRFRGGEILDGNFDTYRLPRFSWVPRIEAVLVPNDELAPQGGGEPSITTTGAVIANAVFNATGARLFRLPMTPARILAAIAGVGTGTLRGRGIGSPGA
jgi:nicotinate dehydrogenase subunit B